MEVRKTWKNWYRYVAGVTGGGIGAIAGLAIAAWGCLLPRLRCRWKL